MAFLKVLKNKAWFKRYQVQYRRRREGKTDYQARRKMTRQAKSKYNARKYRLIVRFSNTKVICQVAYATILGDKVVAQATSPELKNYGITGGYKNYAAAYATGLLVARRCLKKFGLDETFKGKTECDGAEYHVEEEEDGEKRPFKAILDVGTRRTSVGHRMWGALKGAADAGLHVPHSAKNFPGFSPGEGKSDSNYEAEAHKDRILGNHVKEYMEMLQEEDPTKYEAHFSKYIAGGVEPDGMEEMYSGAHSKIRADPDHKPAAAKNLTKEREGQTIKMSDNTSHARSHKITLKQRRAKVQHKINTAKAKMLKAAAEDDE